MGEALERLILSHWVDWSICAVIKDSTRTKGKIPSEIIYAAQLEQEMLKTIFTEIPALWSFLLQSPDR